MKNSIETDDEIKILNKYKNLDIQNKILICLYIIILLNVTNIILPYIINYFETQQNSVISKNVEYDISIFNEISIDDIKKISSKNELTVLYIGTSNCQACIEFLPVLKQAQYNFGYTTNYLNIENITTDEDKEEIFKFDNEDNFIKNSFGSTPMILILKNNKLVEGWVGYSKYSDFENFLLESGFEKEKN